MKWLGAEPGQTVKMRRAPLGHAIKPWREQSRSQKNHGQINEQSTHWPHETKIRNRVCFWQGELGRVLSPIRWIISLAVGNDCSSMGWKCAAAPARAPSPRSG